MVLYFEISYLPQAAETETLEGPDNQFIDPKQVLEARLSQLIEASSLSQNDVTEVARSLDALIPHARAIITANQDANGFKKRMFFEFVIREFRARSLLLNDSLMSDEEMRRGAIKELHSYLVKVGRLAVNIENPLDAASN